MNPVVRLAVPAVATLGLVGVLAAHFLSPQAASPGPAPKPVLKADIVIPANTMPAPNITLPDQNGQPMSVGALRGRVVAITFLDSHCKQLCPIEADQLAQAQTALGRRSPLSLLVVSVAPSTDTPASAKSFAAAHGWTGDWHWLLGSETQLKSVWQAYSIDVKPGASDILHTAVLYLVDRQGYQRAAFASGIVPQLLVRDTLILGSGKANQGQASVANG